MTDKKIKRSTRIMRIDKTRRTYSMHDLEIGCYFSFVKDNDLYQLIERDGHSNFRYVYVLTGEVYKRNYRIEHCPVVPVDVEIQWRYRIDGEEGKEE